MCVNSTREHTVSQKKKKITSQRLTKVLKWTKNVGEASGEIFVLLRVLHSGILHLGNCVCMCVLLYQCTVKLMSPSGCHFCFAFSFFFSQPKKYTFFFLFFFCFKLCLCCWLASVVAEHNLYCTKKRTLTCEKVTWLACGARQITIYLFCWFHSFCFIFCYRPNPCSLVLNLFSTIIYFNRLKTRIVQMLLLERKKEMVEL